jgi:hypothetical protein
MGLGYRSLEFAGCGLSLASSDISLPSTLTMRDPSARGVCQGVCYILLRNTVCKCRVIHYHEMFLFQSFVLHLAQIATSSNSESYF